MNTKIILFTLSLATMSSCGIYNKYKPADTVSDSLYKTEASVNAEAPVLGSLTWQQMFTDPYLQSLINKALESNTDLQIARLRVEQAGASLMAAKLAYLPSFALSPQATVNSIDRAAATKSYSLPVSAAWEIDIFGRVTNSKRVARAALMQSEDYSQAVRSQIISSVANTYYTLLMLDKQLEISQQTEKTWQESVDATRALMAAGMANEAAVSQMQAAYYSVKTSVVDLKEKINQTENALSLLLAETPRNIERGSISNQSFPQSFSVGVPLELLTSRPDVRQAERSLEKAFYTTNMARSSFYPSITLSGTAGWSSYGAIVDPKTFIANAIASLTQPLFNKGALRAQLKVAKLQQEEATLNFNQTILNAGSEVNNALVKYQSSKEKTSLYTLQVNSLEKAFESTSLLMQYGTTTYLDVLTAQQSLLGARLSQVANTFSEIQGYINLYHALGGGAQ